MQVDNGLHDEAKMNDKNDSVNEEQIQKLADLSGTAHVVQVDRNLDDEEDQLTGFFVTAEDSDNVTAYIADLRDPAVSHVPAAILSINPRYNVKFFYGATKSSSAER